MNLIYACVVDIDVKFYTQVWEIILAIYGIEEDKFNNKSKEDKYYSPINSNSNVLLFCYLI